MGQCSSIFKIIFKSITWGDKLNKFIIDQPTLDSYFRGIVLFGKNSATYKFALGKSLIELSNKGTDFISLKDLAIPFIKYTNEHVLNGNKQITSNSSKYFDAFERYNSNECDIDEMVKLTLNNPFQKVIDRILNIFLKKCLISEQTFFWTYPPQCLVEMYDSQPDRFLSPEYSPLVESDRPFHPRTLV